MFNKITSRIPSHNKGIVYISITAFLWSSSGVFIKVLQVSAYHILFYRSAIAAMTIILISLLRKDMKMFSKDVPSNLASVFYAGILFGFVIATKLTTAANAIFLQFTAPVYLLFIEPLFLNTKFDRKNFAAIIITVSGMILFFFGKLDTGNIYGNFIAIFSGICFAFFSLLIKMKKQKNKDTDTTGSILWGNILVSVIAFLIIFPDIKINAKQALILIYMGVFQIGLSYMIFNEGIKYVSATESMIIATLEAIFNPVWVFIGIGEVPSVYAIIGAVFILFAILWRNLRKDEKIIMTGN